MNKKTYKFKYKALLFLIPLLVVGIVGVTLAYFTSRSNIKNEFQVLTYNVDMTEESSGTWGNKKVTVINRDTTPVVVRVSYNEIWSKEDSEFGYRTLNNVINGTNVVNKNWTNTWKNDFVAGDDGWYYYKKVLGASTGIELITSISLNRTVIDSSPFTDDYLSYDYEFNFGFEAIQATEEAVKELWGFDITITDNNIKWF